MESVGLKRQEIDPAALLSKKLLRILLSVSSTLSGTRNAVNPEKALLSGEVLGALDRAMTALRKDDPSAWPVRRLLLSKWDFVRSSLVPVFLMAARLDDLDDRQKVRFAVLKVMVVLTMVPGIIKNDWFATDEWQQGFTLSKRAFRDTLEGRETVLSALGERLIGLFRSKRANTARESARETESLDEEGDQASNADELNVKNDREIELILTLFRNVLHVVPQTSDMDLVMKEQRIQRDRQEHLTVVLELDRAGMYQVITAIFSKESEVRAIPIGSVLLVTEIFQSTFRYSEPAELAENALLSSTERSQVPAVELGQGKGEPHSTPTLSQTEESQGLQSALAREKGARKGNGNRRWGAKFSGSVVVPSAQQSAGLVKKAEVRPIHEFGRKRVDDGGITSRAGFDLGLVVGPVKKRKKDGETRRHTTSTAKGPTALQYNVSCMPREQEKLGFSAMARAADFFVKKCYIPVMNVVKDYLEDQVARNPLIGTSPDEEDIARDFVIFMDLASFLTRFYRHRCVIHPTAANIAEYKTNLGLHLRSKSDFALLSSTFDCRTVKLVHDHSCRLISHQGNSSLIDKGIEVGINCLSETLAALADIIQSHPTEMETDSHSEDVKLARRTVRQIYAQRDVVNFNSNLLKDYDFESQSWDFLATLIQMTRSSLFLVRDDDNVILTKARVRGRNNKDEEATEKDENCEESEAEDLDDLKSVDSWSIMRTFLNSKTIFHVSQVIRRSCKALVTSQQAKSKPSSLLTGRNAIEIFQCLWQAAGARNTGMLQPMFYSLSSLSLYEAILDVDAKSDYTKDSPTLWTGLVATCSQIVDEMLVSVECKPCLGIDMLCFLDMTTCDSYRRAERPALMKIPQNTEKTKRNVKPARMHNLLSEDSDDGDDMDGLELQVDAPRSPEARRTQHRDV